MKKAFLLFILFTNIIVAQDTCASPEESLEDLNSITKCTIEPSKKSKDKRTRQISVRVSAPKRRFLKKRKAPNKLATSNAGALSTSGVTSIQSASTISNALELKKNTAISNIASLSNRLSAEEVRSADRFSTVDDIPLFADCKNGKKGDELDCFNTEMIKHIQEHFRYPNDAVLNKIQGDVWVRFIIDKEGNVSNIKALGPKGGKILDQEAIRVVSKLPKFIPGVKGGKITSVKYGFPISFSLEE